MLNLQKQEDQVDEIEENVDLAVHTARGGTVTMLQVCTCIHCMLCSYIPSGCKI